MKIQLPEYYSLDENMNEVMLYYKDQYIYTFLKDHATVDPMTVEPLNIRILDFITQNKLLIEVKNSVYDPNHNIATSTVSSKQDPLTYDYLRKVEEAMKKSHAGIKPFTVSHSVFRGKSVVLPENYRIVEDPTSIFHEIKIYYLDRHIKTFENDVTEKKIHEFVKEHRNGT